jgi:hypothetical protein
MKAIYYFRLTTLVLAGACAFVQLGSEKAYAVSQASNEMVARDDSGNTYVIWQDYDFSEGQGSVWVAALPSGSSWGSPVKLSGLQDAFNPKIKMNAAGEAVAVWQANVNSTVAIYASKVEFGDTWPSNGTLISDVENEWVNDATMSLSIGPTGRIVVAWEALDISTEETLIRANTCTFAGSWSGPETVSTEI